MRRFLASFYSVIPWLGGLLCLPVGTASGQQLNMTVTWSLTSAGIPNSPGWTGAYTLTVVNNNWLYDGHAVSVGPSGCTVNRTEHGSGAYFYIPRLPSPPTFFTFYTDLPAVLYATWTNTYAGTA